MTAFPFRKAHFIGLAGVGMSATAILLRDSGVAVTGSDEAIYPPISQVLAREAFACRAPYAAQNIPDDADLIVIGKNARLVPNENEEVAEAFTRAARPDGTTPVALINTANVLLERRFRLAITDATIELIDRLTA